MPLQVAIGPVTVNSYTLCVGMGAFCGLVWMLRQLQGTKSQVFTALNAMLVIGVMGLIGGRIGYVVLNIDYFREYAAEAFSTTSPGYSEQTALLGGLVGWAIATRWRQVIDAHSLTLLATLVGIGASLGCVPQGCAYGREVYWTDGMAWLLRVDWPDAYSINNPRLPTQLLMVAWLALCMVADLMITARKPEHASPVQKSSSLAVPIWLVLFAMGDFILQFFRADPSVLLAGLRGSQWLDMLLLFLSCGWIVVSKLAGRSW